MALRTFYGGLPPVILASQSPRRAALLRGMGLEFTARAIDVDERQLVRDCSAVHQPLLLSQAKARAAYGGLSEAERGSLVIAADTVVIVDGRVLDKPRSRAEARRSLSWLSGRCHEVRSGVTLLYDGGERSFESVSLVYFAHLSEAEVEYYITAGDPYDKAGGYGIQEWIGLVSVERVEGSYTNVLGLPTQALHGELLALMGMSSTR